LISWGHAYHTSYLLGGGSHIAKISGVLDYLKKMPAEADDDLVMMMDAFDIWFQLPPETLISRYFAINEAANARIARDMGDAAEIEDIKQKIIFVSGKRCAPNTPHTIACYTVPLSPIPDDIYEGNTDTVIGRNKYTSARQRFLNSGVIIGPVKDMRAMFERAWKKVQEWPNHNPDDHGVPYAEFMYHGSDQAVFAQMFGEQEFQREVMRRRHIPESEWITKKEPQSKIEGTPVGDDILNPPFVHQTMDHYPGKPYEFGIGLDYFSDFSQQTINADSDVRFLRYNRTSEDFLTQASKSRGAFDCKYRGDGILPRDITDLELPIPRDWTSESWEDLLLYTNLCMARLPVMIHHNGDKENRKRSWTKLWIQQHASKIVEAGTKLELEQKDKLGAFTDQAEFLDWDQLCPSAYSAELFRVE
jgi:hypothetical protein